MSDILTGPAAKTEQDINLLCELPGTEGVIWRLVRAWNPDGIRQWHEGEAARGTATEQLQIAIGNLCATAVFVFSMNADKPVDHVVHVFAETLKAKLNRVQGRGGQIIVPGSVQ